VFFWTADCYHRFVAVVQTLAAAARGNCLGLLLQGNKTRIDPGNPPGHRRSARRSTLWRPILHEADVGPRPSPKCQLDRNAIAATVGSLNKNSRLSQKPSHDNHENHDN
jgi:hypothetical protein